MLSKSQPTLDQAINAVVSASHTAARTRAGSMACFSNLPAFIETLDKVANSGSWLNVYICNLTINVQGTINLNVLTGQPSLPLTLPSGPGGEPERAHGELLMKRFSERNRVVWPSSVLPCWPSSRSVRSTFRSCR